MVLGGWKVTREIAFNISWKVMSMDWTSVLGRESIVQDSMGENTEAEMNYPMTGLTNWFLLTEAVNK